jgi:hypothetical protein
MDEFDIAKIKSGVLDDISMGTSPEEIHTKLIKSGLKETVAIDMIKQCSAQCIKWPLLGMAISVAVFIGGIALIYLVWINTGLIVKPLIFMPVVIGVVIFALFPMFTGSFRKWYACRKWLSMQRLG